MLFVPVVSSSGKPLMPCHPARARELVRKGKAIRQFDRGIFFIRLTERSDGVTQDVVVGIDPGSKKEGLTVKSASHTYLNIQADAVTHVKEAKADQSASRRSRRYRQTPCRQPRSNRARGGLPPSTKARWQWKLRLLNWLRRLFPISQVVVEDIKAQTQGKPRWDTAFSPLEVGKQWFYDEVRKLVSLDTFEGYRDQADARCPWPQENQEENGGSVRGPLRRLVGPGECDRWRSRSTRQHPAPLRVAAEAPSPGTASSPAWHRRGAITLRRNPQFGIQARLDRSSFQAWPCLCRWYLGRTNQPPSDGRRQAVVPERETVGCPISGLFNLENAAPPDP